MRKVIQVPNVNLALYEGMQYLARNGHREDTRNGPALVATGPVSTVYAQPKYRVLFSAERDANPFFHLIEAMWIIGGRNDVHSLAIFNSRMRDYSDDGVTFHGAYGYRLRQTQGFDQISRAIGLLRANPKSRQVALQIWDARLDLGGQSKDIPCNDFIFLRTRVVEDAVHGEEMVLDITVANRSNDIIWGAYGANAVQFSFLQEYMAAHLGLGMGRYTQVSNNYHAYTENPYWQKFRAVQDHDTWQLLKEQELRHYYEVTSPVPLLHSGEHPGEIDVDIHMFFRMVEASKDIREVCAKLAEFDSGMGFSTRFFTKVLVPMVHAYATRSTTALDRSIDWHRAGAEWVDRRNQPKENA